MADDVMAFPDTWEEFEKQYGFYDSKQAYMYGNSRLIPSFRVQQWLNHLDNINCKKQSQKNKMEQVAKMFGKKMGEVFTVTYADVVVNANFTSQGLCVGDMSWEYGARVLSMMLLGEAEILENENESHGTDS